MKWRRTLKIRRLAVAFSAVGLVVAATAQARPDETLGPGYEKVQSSMSAANHYPPQALKAEGATLTAKAEALGGMPASSYYTPEALAAESARWTGEAQAYSTLDALQSDGISTLGLRPDDRAGIRGIGESAPVQQPVQSARPDNRPGPQGPGPTFEPVSTPVTGGGFDWADWAIGIGSGLGATALVAAAALMPFRKKRKVTGRVVTSTS
jgi:hypothetical protein